LVYDPFEYRYSSLRYYRDYDFSIVDVPDDMLLTAYYYFCTTFDYSCAITSDKTLGFYPGKPGRK